GAVMPKATHQSFPIPVRNPAGLRVAFLFCKGTMVLASKDFQLWPPSYVAYLIAETGKFQELKAATPKDFGQKHAEDKPIGPYLTTAQRSTPEFMTKQALFYQAYDALLPNFAAGMNKATPDIKKAANEFKQLFAEVTEQALKPYYVA